MPTIFERIDVSLSGNDVTARLSAQVANLGTISSTVDGLLHGQPPSIGTLLDSVRTLPVPDLPVGGDLPGVFARIQAAVPSDLSSLTGGLTQGLEALGTSVTHDLLGAITSGLGPILNLGKLLQIDLTCDPPGSGAPAGAGAGGGGGGGLGGSPPPGGPGGGAGAVPVSRRPPSPRRCPPPARAWRCSRRPVRSTPSWRGSPACSRSPRGPTSSPSPSRSSTTSATASPR